jgi:hypothetical protein
VLESALAVRRPREVTRFGIAHEDHVARGLALSPAHGPEVERVVQVDVGKQRNKKEPP